MSDYYIKNNCRLCDSKSLKVVLPLENSPLCDAYLNFPKKQDFYSLKLCLCNECGFVQLDTVINPETIYRDYIYVTTSSPGLQMHFSEYASDVCNFLDIKSSSLTIDIGSNDGTLLSFFQNKGHRVLGIEPSTKAAKNANSNGIETISEFFDFSLVNQILNNYGKANLITINNLYANVDNLQKFTECIDLILDQDGVLIIESSYLLNMIDNMVFDFIYHEHLSYFSLMPLIRFFKKFDMKLIHAHNVNTKGGSMRYYWARNESHWQTSENVSILTNIEIQAKVDNHKFITYFEKIQSIKIDLINFLKNCKGKKIVGYGASATSTTLISHFDLHGYLSYLVDDNPDKVNSYSPGFNLPVYDSKYLFEDFPDIILVLAWRFEDSIIKRIEGKFHGTVVVPLPSINIKEF